MLKTDNQQPVNLIIPTIISISLGIVLFFAGGIKLALVGIAVSVCSFLSYQYPREAILFILIYLPFSGTIISLLGDNFLLQFAKDAFYVPAAIAISQTCRNEDLPFIIPKEIKYPLFILLGSCLITLLFINIPQQFTSTSGEIPIAMGILGLKIIIGYIPLITCGYYLIRNKQDFLFISRLQVVLILVCCIFGIIQYGLLTVGICEGTGNTVGEDIFKATLGARCFVGGALTYNPSQGITGLPGTFITPWQWAWFLISGTFFSFGTAFNDISNRWRIFGFISFATVFINAIISGQKIALFLVPICFVILLITTDTFFKIKSPLFYVGLILVLGIITPAINYEFITQQFQSAWNLLNQNGNLFFGKGLGTATNAARVFGETRLIESYYPKLIYEVGLLGCLSFLTLVTTLTVVCFKIYRSFKHVNLRSYGAGLWGFILLISFNTFYYPLDVEPVAVYYWFWAGILLKLPKIDKQECVIYTELTKI